MNHEDFQKLVNNKTFYIFILDILFFVSPGILIFFHFDRSLFITIDSIKLILLSIAVSFPLVFWNFIILLLFEKKEKRNDEQDAKMFMGNLSVSILITGFGILAIFALGFLANWDFSTFVKVVLGIEFILTPFFLWKNGKANK